MLTVNLSNDKKYFIMDNACSATGQAKGQVPGTPYYDTAKEATIALFKLSKNNLYDLSNNKYKTMMGG